MIHSQNVQISASQFGRGAVMDWRVASLNMCLGTQGVGVMNETCSSLLVQNFHHKALEQGKGPEAVLNS